MNDQQVIIRQATLDDVAEILRHRRRMYEDMGHKDAAALDAMVASSEMYLRRCMPQGLYRGWLAETPAGEVMGGGGMVINLRLTQPFDPQPRRANILNVYTYPQYRRRGVARKLMQAMIEWCRQEGFAAVSLHASADGRRLYQSLGFEPTDEMRLRLR